MTHYTYCDSPFQPLLLLSDGAALTGLFLVDHKHGREIAPDWRRDDAAAPFPETKRQMTAYFAGTLTEFTLPLAPNGTEFQQRVWDELRLIPYGITLSYGELARRLGRPSAARAVGLANGRNPLSIIVPCHRVRRGQWETGRLWRRPGTQSGIAGAGTETQQPFLKKDPVTEAIGWIFVYTNASMITLHCSQ